MAAWVMAMQAESTGCPWDLSGFLGNLLWVIIPYSMGQKWLGYCV